MQPSPLWQVLIASSWKSEKNIIESWKAPVHPPFTAGPALRSEEVAQGLVQRNSENLSGWNVHGWSMAGAALGDLSSCSALSG